MNLYTWISPHACCGEDKFIVPTILISISVMWGDRNAVWVRRRKAHRGESVISSYEVYSEGIVERCPFIQSGVLWTCSVFIFYVID